MLYTPERIIFLSIDSIICGAVKNKIIYVVQ